MENLVLLHKIACDYNILVVEDSKHINSKLIEFLSKFFYEIDSAYDGYEGLEKFNNKRYDIVLTDINMPKLDGNNFVEKLTKIDPNVQVIVVSAFGYDENIITFNKFGVVDFIQKPVNNIKLADALLKSIENIKDIMSNSNVSYTLDENIQQKLLKIKESKQTVELINSYKGVTVTQHGILIEINEKTLTIQTTNSQYYLIKCEKRTIIVTEDMVIKTNLQYIDKEKKQLILKRFEMMNRSPKDRKLQRVKPDKEFTLNRRYKGETFIYDVSVISLNSISLKASSKDKSFILDSKTDLILGFNISYTRHYKVSRKDKLLKPVKIRVTGHVLKIEELPDGSKKVVFILELNQLSKELLEQYIMQRETDIFDELQVISKGML